MPVGDRRSLAGLLQPLPPLRRRRRARRRWIVLTILAVALAAIAATRLARPLLVYNATASAPLGFYRVAPPVPLRRGDLVLAWAPAAARRLAAGRGYLPASVPLVKRVEALAPEQVCVQASTITIDGAPVAERFVVDGKGRSLPSWEGCRVLGANEVFLLMRGVSDSFDGRYFGTVRTSAVIGRLVPLWTW